MQTKLQELTEKIYQEGVSKAREEGDKLLNTARTEADHILAQANKRADEIVKNAEKQAGELKQNSLNELQLSARQFISDTRQKIVGMLETKAISPEVKGAFKSEDFTRELIQTLVKNWNPKGDAAVDVKVLLPAEKQQELEAFFKGKVSQVLGAGVEVAYSDKIAGGFKIGPKDGGYLISFSDDDFDNLFRGYLRPRLVEMLFGKE